MCMKIHPDVGIHPGSEPRRMDINIPCHEAPSLSVMDVVHHRHTQKREGDLVKMNVSMGVCVCAMNHHQFVLPGLIDCNLIDCIVLLSLSCSVSAI